MPTQTRQRTTGPARVLTARPETYAGMALATSAAHAAHWVRDVPSPQAETMLWACVAVLILGYGWALYRLIQPN